MRVDHIIAVFLLSVSSSAFSQHPSSGAEQAASAEAIAAVSPINSQTQYLPNQYQAVGEAIGASAVVSLGESIHLTREMPLVRLGVPRHLSGSCNDAEGWAFPHVGGPAELQRHLKARRLEQAVVADGPIYRWWTSGAVCQLNGCSGCTGLTPVARLGDSGVWGLICGTGGS